MTFNGLKGSQFAAYHYLLQADLSRPVSYNEIADITCYEYSTIRKAVLELENLQMIKRHRPNNWQPYYFQVIE